MKKKNVAVACVLSGFICAFFLTNSLPLQDTHTPVRLTAGDTSFSFVRSMTGSSTDGGATQTDQGDLVITQDLRLLFDYYLSAIGEKELPEIRKQIEQVLRQKLSAHAAGQAMHLLDHYLAYKQALADFELHGSGDTLKAGNQLAAIRQRWQKMQTLRLEYFSSAENQALFSFDDAYDQDALARLEISQDATLSLEQKKARLQALDDAMNPEMRASRQAPYQVIRLEEQVQQMRSQGASEDDIYRWRAQNTSPEAAERLAAVDREQAEWKDRIRMYLEQRQLLLSHAGNTADSAQLSGLQQIRDRYFSPQEQRRLAAYEGNSQ